MVLPCLAYSFGVLAIIVLLCRWFAAWDDAGACPLSEPNVTCHGQRGKKRYAIKLKYVQWMAFEEVDFSLATFFCECFSLGPCLRPEASEDG